jgi:hypothetical protein
MLMSLKQTGFIRKYVKALFRSSPWTFLIWRKRIGSLITWKGYNLRQNFQDLWEKQAASQLDWKYLARGSRDQAKGKDPNKKPSLRPRKASSRFTWHFLYFGNTITPPPLALNRWVVCDLYPFLASEC